MSTQTANPPISQNGTPMNGHSRTPSMTVTPAGTTSYNQQPQNKANVQFGSLNNGGNSASSPAMSTPQPVHTQNNSLGVNNLAPRMPSPSNSPSPIPQPVQVSGGRPPSEFNGAGKNMSFGQFGGDGADVNVCNINMDNCIAADKLQGMTRSLSQMQMSDHARRGSQQSDYASMGQNFPTGPGRGGYANRGGRGGYANNYSGHVPFNPANSNFRPNQRGGYQGRGGHNMPYQQSPSMQHRTPMMNSPGPQMASMQMNPAMQYSGYQQYPVNKSHPRSSSEAVRGKPNRGSMRGSKGRKSGKAFKKSAVPSMDMASDNYVGPALADTNAGNRIYSLPAAAAYFPYPDLSPDSGNFENFLTCAPQNAYGQIPIQADPSIQYSSQMYYPQQAYSGFPPQSPRPPYQQPGYGGQQMQNQYSNQGQMPQPMSRQSSQMSAAEQRPASSIGQTPQTPAAALAHTSARTPSISGAEKNFERPAKKSSAIVIKNAAGEVVDFSKKTPAPAAATVVTPSAPTPPSRTGSAVSAAHTRSDSQSVKPDDKAEKQKAMQEAIARKIAQDKEEADKARKQKEAEEQKAQMDAEAAAAAEREAAEKKVEAERLAKEAEEAEEREKALEAEKAKKAEEEKAKQAEEDKAKAEAEPPALTEDEEFERMVAEMEREQAEKEAEEARKEEEYMKKRAAEKAAAAQKEKEEAEAYETNMKELERKAEEEELAREKKRQEGGDDDAEAKKKEFLQFAGKADDAAEDTEESPAATPMESGAATPLSDMSMGPPAKPLGSLRRGKPAELTLNTKASTEPPEPSATLKSLQSAKKLDSLDISYPAGIISPNPAVNPAAPSDRKFKYNKDFLLQFQNVFKEKPSLDWDQKIREALGHDDSARPQTARTPSGMGGRSASNRGPAGNAFAGPMGAFGGGNRVLPPNTTSAERFAASNAARGGAMQGNPFGQFQRSNMGPPMGRTPSNNPMGLPGSPRVGGSTRGGSRAESKRGNRKQEQEQNKSMPLTAGMNVGTLEVSSTGWKARSLGPAPAAAAPSLDGYMEADVVQRKVKAALNKMTPEKFDRISDQILEIAAQSVKETDGRTLRQVIQLVFEKATDEAHWAPMYAKFCYKMLSTMNPEIKDETIKDKAGNVVAGGNLFRKYLLNRCQEEFEKGWKVNLPAPKEGENQEAVMLSDEYYVAAAAKRRGLGLVKFIGELFKLGMLTERIMHECVKKLLDYEGMPEEAEVESLSSLLRTIGKQLDSPESKGAGRMDAYFERITQTMNLPDLPSRLRFMLLDVVDLRRAGWNSKDADKGPKTIQQIREEAEAAAAQAEMQRLASQASGRGGGRMPMGRGDVRSFSNIPPPDNSGRVQAEDLRRLGGRSQRNTSTPSGQFGPSSLGARTNSRRGLGPPQLGSAGTSRTGTPPAQADAKKDESSTNAFR